MYVVATIVDFPHWIPDLNTTGFLPEATKPLKNIIKDLKKAISEGKLGIDFMNLDPVSQISFSE